MKELRFSATTANSRFFTCEFNPRGVKLDAMNVVELINSTMY